MHGKIAVSAMFALALLAFAMPGTAHHTGADETAYVGVGSITGTGVGVAICQSPPSDVPLPFGVGGACHLDLPTPEGSATLSVSDDVFGDDNAFAYWCTNEEYGNVGDVFEGQGTATVEPIPGCYHVSVAIQTGVAGTISLS